MGGDRDLCQPVPCIPLGRRLRSPAAGVAALARVCPAPLAMFQFTRGSLIAMWGDLETAEELLRSAIASFRDLEPRSLIWWLGELGFILAIVGKRQEALATLNELEALIAPLPEGAMPTAHALCHMAAIVAWLEDRESFRYRFFRKGRSEQMAKHCHLL